MKIGTHNGRFHSDDLFSVALLTTLFPDAEIIRSRDQAVLDQCDLVLDVGGTYDADKLRFDHHMPGGAGKRPNGINYSALGLLWPVYGLQYCGGNEVVWQRLNDGFISSFDAYDNGQRTYEITTEDATVVELQDVFDKYLNPAIGEPSDIEDYDRAFMNALPFAKLILERAVKRKTAEVESEQYFYEQWQASPDRRYVVLEKFATAGEKAEEMPELLYYMYQDPNKKWNVKALPKSKDTYELKKPLPEAWAGLRDEELEQASGVKGAAFCHNARFLMGAYTKEAALEMLKVALNS